MKCRGYPKQAPLAGGESRFDFPHPLPGSVCDNRLL